jgi:hypothetical protein
MAAAGPAPIPRPARGRVASPHRDAADELAGLDADAVVQIGAGHWLRIPLGKLRNDRYVPLHPELVDLLTAWTAANLKHIRHCKRLVAYHRGPLDRHLIGRIVRRVGNAAGIPGVHPAPAAPHAGHPVSQPATTSPSSPSGSATRASKLPRSTCTPTSRSKNRPSTARPRRTQHRADTGHPTRCWRSWNNSDYAERLSRP